MTIASTHPLRRLCLSILAGLSLVVPSWAQYKVVDPDGRVTYTDRPPAPSAGARISPIRRDGTVAQSLTAGPELTLPLELRAVVGRFPVNLYSASDCAPCDNARRMLRTRGVPFAERLVSEDTDSEALERLSGGRTIPTMTVGGQILRGYAETDWQSTLDLAGYPRESRLPKGYVWSAATPLVARAVPKAPEPDTPAPTAVVPLQSAPGIRF